MKSLPLPVKILWSRFKFLKVGQTSRSLGQKLWNGVKDLVTRNAHVKYECPIYTGSEVTGKIKVFVHVDAPLSRLLPGVITIALWTFILGC